MRRRKRPERVELRDASVLLTFLCREFGYHEIEEMFAAIRKAASDPATDTPDGYADALTDRGRRPGRVGLATLRDYRANIEAVSRRLRMTADHGRTWKPHQYLALLFVERFLDRYFGDADAFCHDLNRSLRDRRWWGFPEYREEDLRTFAVQSATGSGKTLLMHANIVQYQHYLERAGAWLNNIVLLTPTEQMSAQHEREMRESGLRARRFDPRARREIYRTVEILDINKLADKKGVKRVAVSEFGDDNLVLVDEGHLGASGKIWRQRRAELARGGFSIEYSATFNQVARKHEDLRIAYSRSLLFDYGYRQFHADGYGKDYTISNLPAGMEDANSDMYLLGCLLTFYQQSWLYREKNPQWLDFHLSKPLWVFLGKTVSGSSRTDREARSDVVRILDFLGWFLARGSVARRMIRQLLRGDSGLEHPRQRRDYFVGRFPHLAGQNEDRLYAEICETLFHGAGRLRVVYLTSGEGELHLRVADGAPFGVVNVGDSAALYKLLGERENADFDLERNAGFADLLFHGVDRSDSPVTIVVGARRFIAGWNSWRVSTMGLMHVGVGEGPEIIQMFGRGVRLLGWKRSLKRYRQSGAPAPEDDHGLSELETLHIFGLRANYMETFERILQEEGIRRESDPVPLPVTWNFAKKTDLKLIRLRKDTDYPRSPDRPVLPGPADEGRRFVECDLYGEVQVAESSPGAARRAADTAGATTPPEKNRVRLAPRQVAFFDRGRIYDALLRQKRQHGWHNLVIERQTVDALLDDNDWYDLRIPPEALHAKGFARWRALENYAVDLLTEYADGFWKQRRRSWEHDRLEVVTLSADDPNNIREYELSGAAAEKELVDAVRRLSSDIGRTIRGLSAIWTKRHAYEPLLHADEKCEITVHPAPLNWNETQVVNGLSHAAEQSAKWLRGRELFLIRNLTRGRGVSFFDDYEYYPDFIIWLKNDLDQHVVFLDPKGLSRLGRRQSRKVDLHRRIRDIEKKVRESDPGLYLHSYVLSSTRPEDIGDLGYSRAEWEAQGVYFLSDLDCLERIITHALDSRGGTTDGA